MQAAQAGQRRRSSSPPPTNGQGAGLRPNLSASAICSGSPHCIKLCAKIGKALPDTDCLQTATRREAFGRALVTGAIGFLVASSPAEAVAPQRGR